MFSSSEQIRELFHTFENLKVLIVGDVMIDCYLKGKVDRISPEAPVPVVALQHRENMLGGAANVALNIKSLGAKPLLCSVIGQDIPGSDFIKLLELEGIETDGILKVKNRITTTKYRIIGNKMQMLRVDHETDEDINSKEENDLLVLINKIIGDKKPDVIVLQDYNKGVLTPAVIEGIIQDARKKSIPVVVDPKRKNFTLYHSIALFKPNLKEIREGLKIDVDSTSQPSLLEAAKHIHTEQEVEKVMITMSEDGIFVSQCGNESFESAILPAHKRNIADASGAGDTVISVAALCIATGISLKSMAGLSNLAGGLVCEHIGVIPVDKQELLKEAISILPSIKRI